MKLLSKLLLFFALILCWNTALQAQEIVAIWEKGKMPNHQISDEKEEVVINNITHIKKVQNPTLEIYLPTKQNANGKGVLILPGGGYGNLSYDWEGTDYAKWFNSQGVAAFVLKYRLPQSKSVVTSYKGPIQDAQRAMRYIRAHAEKFNVEKSKVGVIGSSAGGHLASTLGTHEEVYYDAIDTIDKQDFRPNFMMLIYPVISMKKGVTHMGSRNNLLGKNPTKELVAQFSNELRVTETTPSTFIVHSGNDKAVPVENSLLLYQSLLQKNISTTMHIFPDGGHGYSFGKSKEQAPDWTGLAAEWLQKLN